jgi:hypothetical protein
MTYQDHAFQAVPFDFGNDCINTVLIVIPLL